MCQVKILQLKMNIMISNTKYKLTKYYHQKKAHSSRRASIVNLFFFFFVKLKFSGPSYSISNEDLTFCSRKVVSMKVEKDLDTSSILARRLAVKLSSLRIYKVCSTTRLYYLLNNLLDLSGWFMFSIESADNNKKIIFNYNINKASLKTDAQPFQCGFGFSHIVTTMPIKINKGLNHSFCVIPDYIIFTYCPDFPYHNHPH